jgi:hypothetical protein
MGVSRQDLFQASLNQVFSIGGLDAAAGPTVESGETTAPGRAGQIPILCGGTSPHLVTRDNKSTPDQQYRAIVTID